MGKQSGLGMKKLYGVAGAETAEGTVVIIDVFRAASTAAYILAGGASYIIPVSGKEEGLAYKNSHPGYLLVGEQDGIKFPEYDYGNSPSETRGVDFTGTIVVQRTTDGTQGLVRATHADEVIFGSFVTASAILSHLTRGHTEQVTFVAMGGEGSDDDLFADYMIDRLRGKIRPIKEIIEMYLKHPLVRWYLDPEKPKFPREDFDLCLALDRFPFIVRCERSPFLHLVKEEACV